MNGVALGVAFLATAAGAFAIGRNLSPSAAEADAPAEVERLRGEVARLETALASQGRTPTLRPGERPDAPAAGDPVVGVRPLEGRPSGGAGATEGGDPPATLDLEGVTDADEALRRILAFAEGKLAAGPKGHLELVAAIDAMVKGDQLKRLFNDEAGAARVVYPLLRFAVTHEGQMVALTETVFKTMAENPAALDSVDDDTIEMFTEGFSMALPGAVDEPTLDRFRTYGKRILDTPEGQQPESIRKNRSDIGRAMGLWAPPLSSADAAERLRRGDASGQEVLALLKRVTPEDVKGLDLAGILGPLVESGDSRAIWGLRGLPLDGRTLASLDDRLIAAAAAGKVQGWSIPQYLDSTGRRKFADARPFLDRGLGRGDKATEAFAQALVNLPEPAPAEYVQSVLSTYTLSEGVRALLSRRVGGK